MILYLRLVVEYIPRRAIAVVRKELQGSRLHLVGRKNRWSTAHSTMLDPIDEEEPAIRPHPSNYVRLFVIHL